MSHLKSVPLTQMLMGKLKRLTDWQLNSDSLIDRSHTHSILCSRQWGRRGHTTATFTFCAMQESDISPAKLKRFVQQKPNKTASNGKKEEKPVKERKWADVLVKCKQRQRDGHAHTQTNVHAALGVNQAHDRIFGSELEVVNRILTWRGRGRHCYYRLSWLGLSGPHAACHKELALRKHEEPHSATLTSRRIRTGHGYSPLSLLCLSLLADFCHSFSH